MKLGIIQCSEYTQDQVFSAVEQVVDCLGGMECFVRPGQKVLLKPNLLTGIPPERAATTHPLVVEGVVRLVLQAGGQVYIGDSPGLGTMERVMDACGYGDLLDKYDVTLADFSHTIHRTHSKGNVAKKIPLAKAVEDVDVIINLPKPKSHGLTVYTGAIKNMFGCVPGLQKGEYHLKFNRRDDFAQFLVDLYTLVTPNLTIMDGVIGMEGSGPRNGIPKEIGLILASADGVVVDQYITEHLGLSCSNVPLIKQGIEQGLGVSNLDDIQLEGQPPGKKIVDFKWSKGMGMSSDKIPPLIYKILQNSLIAKPEFLTKPCTGCRSCIDVCPPRALVWKEGRIKIDRKACINCYCCQELCPENAVTLKPGRLSRLWNRRK